MVRLKIKQRKIIEITRHELATMIFFLLCLLWMKNGSVFQSLLYSMHGDAPMHMSVTFNFLCGNYLNDSTYFGNPMWYPPLYRFILGLISLWTGISVSQVYVAFPHFIHLPIVIIFYFFVRSLYGSWSALFSSFALMFMVTQTLWHLFFMVPFTGSFFTTSLTLLVYMWALKKRSRRRFVLVGIFFGLAILTHVTGTLLLVGVIALHMLLRIVGESIFDLKKFRVALKNYLFSGLIILAVGLSLSFPYWFWPLVHYRLNILNPVPVFWVAKEIIDLIRYPFFGEIPLEIYLTLLLGTTICAIRRNDSDLLVLAFLVVCMVGRGAIYIFPELHFQPAEFQYYLHFLAAITFGISVPPLISFISEAWEKSIKGRWLTRNSLHGKTLVFLVLLLLLSPYVLRHEQAIAEYVETNREVYAGVCSYPSKDWKNAIDWIKANTNINDVFLCSVSSAYYYVNGLTGRKVVVSDEAHTNAFINYKTRFEDTRLMYGNLNREILRELLLKYHVKFILASPNEDFEGSNLSKFAQWSDMFKRKFQSGSIIIYEFLESGY